MADPTKPKNDQVPPQPDSQDPAPALSSLWHGPSHARLWIVAVVGLTIDLSSKHWAFQNLNGLYKVIPNLLHFQRSLNPGALFGFGHGMTPVFIAASGLALLFVLYLFAHTPRRRWSMHIGLGMILAGALGNLYDRAFVKADAVWAPSPIGWRNVLGDQVYITGKLIREDDNYWYFADWPDGGGAVRSIKKQDSWHIQPSPVVRDFIKIDTSWLPQGFQLWKWIFNVADALLVVGVGLLLLNFYLERKAEEPIQARPAGQDQEAA
jgi:lipoprotein signal peptidase